MIEDSWIYRYRSMSPLSLKELIYDEIYFSYPDELNDPLDLGAELIIKEGAPYVYDFFISGALKGTNLPRPKDISKEQADFIRKVSNEYSKSPNNIFVFFTEENKEWLRNHYRYFELSEHKFEQFHKYLLNSLSNIFPSRLNSVSFSKDCNNPLLWSLYGEQHKGFCIIFSPTENKLKLKNSMNSDFREFEYYKVNYDKNIDVDLSLMFNNKKEFDYDDLYNRFFPELARKALLTKNSNWYKENEVRMHGKLEVSFSHQEKYTNRLTSIERTYNFERKQLAGVVLGYGMSQSERNEIVKIFESKKQSVKIFEAIPQGNEIDIQIFKTLWYQ